MTNTENCANSDVSNTIYESQLSKPVSDVYQTSTAAKNYLGAEVSDVLRHLWVAQNQSGTSVLGFSDREGAQFFVVFRDDVDGPWIVADINFDITEGDYENAFSTIEEAFEQACCEVAVSDAAAIFVEWRSRYTYVVDRQTGHCTSVPRTDIS